MKFVAVFRKFIILVVITFVYLLQDHSTTGRILVHILPFFLVMLRLLKNGITLIALSLECMSMNGTKSSGAYGDAIYFKIMPSLKL